METFKINNFFFFFLKNEETISNCLVKEAS